MYLSILRLYDKNNDGHIDLDEFKGVMKDFTKNAPMAKPQIEYEFNFYDKDESGRLNRFQFVEFLNKHVNLPQENKSLDAAKIKGLVWSQDKNRKVRAADVGIMGLFCCCGSK